MQAHLLLKASAFSVAIVLGASAALAQSTAEAPEASSDDIIVTAQGREQNLQDVPVSVSVVSGDTLRAQGITTLQDMSNRVSNVKITTGTLVNSINVRGVGSGENPGFEQAVATFVDGVYRSRSRSTIAGLFDVERVEVLKGPQTTFFGANAIAGALSITTRKPGNEFEYNASGLYGFSDGEYDLQAGVTLPVNENLSVRLAGRASGMNGWIDLPDDRNGPHDRSYQGRFALHWTPSDSWTTDFRVDYARSRTTDFAIFQVANCPAPSPFPQTGTCQGLLGGGLTDTKLDFKSEATPGSYLNFDWVEAALTNTIDTGFGTLKTITAFSDMKTLSRASLVPGVFAFSDSPFASPSARWGYDAFTAEGSEKYRFFSQEVRLDTQIGDNIDLMAGVYYHHGHLQSASGPAGFFFAPFGLIVESAFQVDFSDFGANTPITGWPSMEQFEDTFSGFAAVTWRPTDKFRVNLGGRYSIVDKSAHRTVVFGTSVNGQRDTFVQFSDEKLWSPVLGRYITRGEGFSMIVGSSPDDFAITSRSDSQFMPSASVQFDVNSDVMLFASYTHGFKAGGFSATSSPSVFGPEKVNSYEAGVKSSLFDRMLTFNVTAFLMDYKGLQETTFNENLASSITNVAAARSQGIEVSTNLHINENISINADLAYLDATYRDFPNAECTKISQYNGVCAANGGVQDLSGVRRAYAPEFSGNVGVDLNVPVGDFDLKFQPNMYFTTNYFMTATADDLFRQPGYQKFDLRVALSPRNGPWEVALIGRNLTNEVTTSYRLGMPGANGSVVALVERARSVGIQFTIKN